VPAKGLQIEQAGSFDSYNLNVLKLDLLSSTLTLFD
jgi:hypothetical protein